MSEKQTQYTYTHKSGPFNSTDFTSCCGLAVLRDDTKCPGCQALVIRYAQPYSQNCVWCEKPRWVCHC
jgi:hypothetical protein